MTDDADSVTFHSSRTAAQSAAPTFAAAPGALMLAPALAAVEEPTEEEAARKTVLVVAQTEDIGARVKEAIGLEGEYDVTVQARPLSQLLHDGAMDLSSYDILVFEAHIENDLEMKTLRELRQRCPRTTNFLAVTTQPLTLAYAKCLMEIEIDEVLPLNSLRSDHIEKAETSPNDPGEASRNGVILTVSKTCGGIGATSLVLNTGFALSGNTKRAKDFVPPRIALVDLDFQNGTLGASIDLEDTGAYLDLLKGECDADQAFLREAMVPYKDRFDVLPAPVDFAPLESMTPEKMSQLLTELRKAYDYVILDLPRAVTGWIEPILASTDKMLIVTDTSVHSVRQARRMIKLFTEEHDDLPIDIIVSKEKKPFTQPESIKEAVKLLERPLDIWLPRDDSKARKAADLGLPILEAAHKSAIAKPLSKLVGQVRDLHAKPSRREA